MEQDLELAVCHKAETCRCRDELHQALLMYILYKLMWKEEGAVPARLRGSSSSCLTTPSHSPAHSHSEDLGPPLST